MFFRLVTVILFIYSQMTLAQISITANDILGLVGSSQLMEVDTSGSITVNVGSAGANQNCNFSNITMQGITYSYNYINPSGTPFANNFQQANFVQYSQDNFEGYPAESYSYISVTPELMSILGTGTIISNPDTQFVMLDNDQIDLPLTYGASWTSTSSDTFEAGPGIFSLYINESTNMVDAWGTLTLSEGTFECLRIRENYKSIIQTVFNGQIFFTDTTNYISYQWISKEAFVLVVIESQEDETDPNFSNAASVTRLASSNPTALPKLEITSTPNDFDLQQNYPNPFNPTTSIPFSLDRSEFVSIEVYDQNGQLVKTLINEYKSAGIYEVNWDGTNNLGAMVASGPYFYTLRAGNQKISTRQMFLIK
jgi:hypothetical protein